MNIFSRRRWFGCCVSCMHVDSMLGADDGTLSRFWLFVHWMRRWCKYTRTFASIPIQKYAQFIWYPFASQMYHSALPWRTHAAVEGKRLFNYVDTYVVDVRIGFNILNINRKRIIFFHRYRNTSICIVRVYILDTRTIAFKLREPFSQKISKFNGIFEPNN